MGTWLRVGRLESGPHGGSRCPARSSSATVCSPRIPTSTRRRRGRRSRRWRRSIGDRRRIMAERIARRRERALHGRRISLSASPTRSSRAPTLRVRDAREGRFTGSEIPADLQRQWIQGTGPATRPRATAESGLRNVAYALLSGADGWMFDGEDALGQVDTMSLDNQRNLKLAFDGDPIFLRVAEEVAAEMNALGPGLPGPADIRRLAQAARLHHPDLPSPRTAPRRPPRARSGRHRLFRIDRRPRALRREQPRATAGARAGPSSSTSRRSRPPKRRRCGTTCSPRSSGTSGCRSGPSRSTCSSSRSRPAFS